ncbi:tyrosine-type recombinase/integrase [Kribbella sp. NPDC054772]
MRDPRADRTEHCRADPCSSRKERRLTAKRRFGRVRKLPSGRFQARYPGPDGIDWPAPNTFASKTDAARWLTLREAELAQDEWIDPAAGERPLGDYAQKWIRERPGLRSKTLVLYSGLLRNHIAPTLGTKPLRELTAPMLRGWRQSALDGGLGPVTAAKAYRLLRSILSTAVEDDSSKPTRATSRELLWSAVRSDRC